MNSSTLSFEASIDGHILRVNLIEFLTNYLEGEASIVTVLQITERIFQRDHKTLSPSLLTVATTLHAIKIQIDAGETVSETLLKNTISDLILLLIAD